MVLSLRSSLLLLPPQEHYSSFGLFSYSGEVCGALKQKERSLLLVSAFLIEVLVDESHIKAVT